MKKRSVLIRRAALFTATVMAVTVAVSLCGYGIATWIQSRAAAKNQIIPQLEYLLEMAGKDAPGSLEDAAKVVAASGSAVWLQDGDWNTLCLTGDDELPGIGDDIDNGVLQAAEGFFKKNGRTWYYQDALLDEDVNHYLGRIAVAAPLKMPSWLGFVPVALIAALLGFLGARYVLMRQKKIEDMMQSQREIIARQRDAAVAMADGHLETRADEKVEGELGEVTDRVTAAMEKELKKQNV